MKAQLKSKSDMTAQQLLVLQSEMALQKRSVWTAYIIFATPLSFLGGHHWYLRNYGRAMFYPLSIVLVFVFYAFGSAKHTPMANQQWYAGLGTGVILAYFVIIALDFCTLAFQVGRANRRIERKLMKSISPGQDDDDF